jgi:hypothetical protein
VKIEAIFEIVDEGFELLNDEAATLARYAKALHQALLLVRPRIERMAENNVDAAIELTGIDQALSWDDGSEP